VRSPLIFFLLLLLTTGAFPVSAAKRVALVIGSSNYTLAPLSNPVNDADDMAAALTRLEFEVAEQKLRAIT
jgi:hypothetical protein